MPVTLLLSFEYWCGVDEQTLSTTQGVVTASVKELDNEDDRHLSIFSPGASFTSEHSLLQLKVGNGCLTLTQWVLNGSSHGMPRREMLVL